MRVRTQLKRMSILCTGVLLLGCTGLSQRFSLSERFSLIEQSLSTRSADDAYMLGKNYHLARRYDDAIRSYRTALAADPSHLNARNGMATVYAERREFGQAIQIWRSLTEKVDMSSGPGSAYLFSNLGYAYFLSGDYENATIALEKACLLDPLNHRAWHHLGETLQKLGQQERAQEMFRQADALRGHDLRADVAASGGTRVAAIEAAVRRVERAADELATTEIAKREDGLLELRRIPAIEEALAEVATTAGLAAPEPVRPPEPSRSPMPAPAVALLEIRNGNGVTGMARSLKQTMGDPSLKVTRLTNDKGFNVRQTRIEYVNGFRDAAQRLAQRFDNARVVKVDNVTRTDMRLVIGRDIAHPKFVLRPLVQPVSAPVLADATRPERVD